MMDCFGITNCNESIASVSMAPRGQAQVRCLRYFGFAEMSLCVLSAWPGSGRAELCMEEKVSCNAMQCTTSEVSVQAV